MNKISKKISSRYEKCIRWFSDTPDRYEIQKESSISSGSESHKAFTMRHNIWSCAVFIFILSSLGCTSLQPQEETRTESGTSTNGSSSEFFSPEAPTILNLINEARAEGRSCGEDWYDAAPPVLWDSDLSEAATLHTKDMSTHAFRGHEGSDGSLPKDRVEEVKPRHFRAVGEILAYFQESNEQAMESWLESPGHCKILMTQEYTHIGAAVKSGPRFDDPYSEGEYRTVKFGRLLDWFHTEEKDRELLSSVDIRIFSSEGCNNTQNLRHRLERANIPYTFWDRSKDDNKRLYDQARIPRMDNVHTIRSATPIVIIEDYIIRGANRTYELAEALRELRSQ